MRNELSDKGMWSFYDVGDGDETGLELKLRITNSREDEDSEGEVSGEEAELELELELEEDVMCSTEGNEISGELSWSGDLLPPFRAAFGKWWTLIPWRLSPHE